jgi:hypothetical protein
MGFSFLSYYNLSTSCTKWNHFFFLGEDIREEVPLVQKDILAKMEDYLLNLLFILPCHYWDHEMVDDGF